MNKKEYSDLLVNLGGRKSGTLFIFSNVETADLTDPHWSELWNSVNSQRLESDGFNDAAQRTKLNLLNYCLSNGPFAFVRGKCYLILVPLFEWEDWQYPCLKVLDVTQKVQTLQLPRFTSWETLKQRFLLAAQLGVGLAVFWCVSQLFGAL